MILLLCAVLAIVPNDLFHELRWRPVGPLRGGRTKAATGVPQRPGTFYIGAVNGGVFRTDDDGRTWEPLFDAQPTASIGAIAVAPSNPDVVYVGSGEGMHRPDLSTGDGFYRSRDGGRSWTHLGLRDAQQIAQIAVDPRDERRLFVAVLGHPYGPNEERGIFRSTDGGDTFERVLYRDADTGGADVVIDPAHPEIVYASLWEAREAPWENGEFAGPGSGLYKSTDAGKTWKPLAQGLPDFPHDGLGRIGIGLAPSRTSRVFLTVAARKNGGLYRSDDGGDHFERINPDERVTERGDDFAEVKVDPTNPEVVYTASVAVWRSTDGGRSFSAFRGAPGGDDYQRIWIDPQRPEHILIACDQGAIVTLNGGRSFSSWYTQPTAQMFHVSADNAFPYRLCGGQQDSGSACVPSRGNDGAITFRDWHSAGLEEYGYAAPDPRDPDIVYGGKVSRWDRRTGQTQDVSPRLVPGKDYRVLRTEPLFFSDPATLLFGANTVFRSTDGAQSWTQISPDLAREAWTIPANVGKYRGEVKVERRGVVYALAARGDQIWAGTDDGRLQLSRNRGRTWTDVTPPGLPAWAKVAALELSAFAPETAYAAINTLRLDDLHPHLLRTRDGGRTWTDINAGLAGVTNVVREDPRRRGLLYAGTETGVFVSWNDGESWSSLRLNLPATSVRDLIVKDDDLAIATHGRGFWILDDAEPLREITDAVSTSTHLFTPARATRVRFDTNTDTPLPPDEPMMPNPPDGAILDYALSQESGVTLEIADAQGKVIRRYSSDDKPQPVGDEGNVPRWWIRPSLQLGTSAGLHRFVWDLHEEAPRGASPGFPIAAVPGNTPREPRGPWALPGTYTVRLTAGGQTETRPLVVRMDPRVKTPLAALKSQHDLAARLAAALGAAKIDADREALQRLYEAVQGADAAPTAALQREAEARLKAAAK